MSASDAGYVELARAVIHRAVADLMKGPDDIGSSTSKDYCTKLTDLRWRLKHRIDAGKFLLFRDDPQTRLWFGLAGVEAVSPKKREMWRKKYEHLVEAQRDLEQKIVRAMARREIERHKKLKLKRRRAA